MSRLAAAPLTVVDLARDRQTVISSGCTRYLTLLVRVFLHAKPGSQVGDGEAAGKESVKHQKTQRVLDGRLNAANDVARERNVEEESFNNESIAAKRKRSRRESESKKEGNEKVRDNEEEKRILGKNSISSVNSAKNKNRASNPNVKGAYSFHSQRLKSQFRSQNGHFRVLERFSKKSELLCGLENYRFEIVEANPNTFVIPHHCDSDAVLFVLRGEKGIMTFVSQWKGESYSLERGDVMKVRAGVVRYLINPDDNEKFSAAMLVNPVNTPGKFREYFAAGGENPESVYIQSSAMIFSRLLLLPRDQLDRLFGQQKQGMILKAPKEKLKALSQHASSSKHKRSHEGKGPINLLNQRRPLYSNKFGKFFEVTPNDYKQLQVQPICRLLRPEIAGVDIYPRSEVVVQTNNSAWKYAGHVTEVMELSKPTALVQAVRSHTGNVAVHSTKVHPAHHQVLRNVLEGGRLP
eukprot:XP_024466452.1 vicilin-like antimicrobial peptides 2-2 [Populus trichocarpa]